MKKKPDPKPKEVKYNVELEEYELASTLFILKFYLRETESLQDLKHLAFQVSLKGVILKLEKLKKI